jgi:hypothetical protein
LDGICSTDKESKNYIEQFGKPRGKRPVHGSNVNGSILLKRISCKYAVRM